MKKIELIKLTLTDFKGMTFALEADGEDTKIFGKNEAGKTTVTDAFHWLLFDKDSMGKSDFQVKNIIDKVTGETAHGLTHSVEGVLLIDGDLITLKKDYYEVWTTPRGRARAVCTGHTTDYFVDGVNKPKKDYTTLIKQMTGDEATFRLLTSPTAVPSLEWKKRRDIIMSFREEVTDQMVIESDGRLAGLTELVGKKKLDDVRAMIRARQKKIEEQKAEIPVRISEQKKMLPDITGLDRAKLEVDLKTSGVSLADANLRLSGIDNGSAIIELSKGLAGINADLLRMESAHYTEAMKQVNKLSQEIAEAEGKAQSEERRIFSINGELQAKNKQMADLDDDLQKLRDEWTEIDDTAMDIPEFEDTTKSMCPACGQDLPAERVQVAREKALADYNDRKASKLGRFNDNKASQLEEIERTGARKKEEQGRLVKEIEILTAERAKLNGLAAAPATGTLERRRDELKKKAESYTEIEGHSDLIIKRADYVERIEAEKKEHSQDTDKIKHDIANYQMAVDMAKELIDRFVKREAGEKRIAELAAEEKVLAAEYEKLEAEFYLTDQFIKRKCDMISEGVNSMFEFVRWKLFEIQVNGNVNDQMCEPMVNGVPYHTNLNNAGRIQAGCDIVRTLQRFYGLHAPLFLDNREGVTKIPDMECQVISLYVSEQDSTLRVERVHKETIAVQTC